MAIVDLSFKYTRGCPDAAVGQGEIRILAEIVPVRVVSLWLCRTKRGGSRNCIRTTKAEPRFCAIQSEPINHRLQ